MYRCVLAFALVLITMLWSCKKDAAPADYVHDNVVLEINHSKVVPELDCFCPFYEAINFNYRGGTFYLSLRRIISKTTNFYEAEAYQQLVISVEDTLIYKTGEYRLFSMPGQGARFVNGYKSCSYETYNNTQGMLTITSLDSTNHVIKGKFEMNLANGKCDSVNIRGVFDLDYVKL